MKESDYLSRSLEGLWGSNPHLLIQKSELIQIPTKILVELSSQKTTRLNTMWTMGGDKRFKARWTNNYGVGTSNVNKSLPTPHDFSGTLKNN